MNLPVIPNYGLLEPKPTDPSGYVTKDGMWAAVPFGKKFMILHNGQQVHVANNYKTARAYISKQIKSSKATGANLNKFL